MAVDITGSTILLPVITKVENQDVHGKNWATEIVQLVAGDSNSGTTYTLNTSTTSWPKATTATGPLHISVPMFVTVDGEDDSTNVAVAKLVTYGAGLVVVTWKIAPTSVTIRIKIEGWA